MLQATAISNFERIKTLAAESFDLGQVQKAAAVALSCILFFGFQLCCSWSLTAGIALACSAVTLLSEALLRKGSDENTNWMNLDIDPKFLMIQVAIRLTILPVFIALITSFGVLPLQEVALQLLAGDWRIIFLVTLVAPVAEEFFFRGFIQERLEDLAVLVNRHIYPLSRDARDWFSTVSQSLLFGAVHILGGQVHTRVAKILVFCQITGLGFVLAWIKAVDKSLLSPIAIHSAQNTGATLGLLAAKALS